MSGQTGPKTGGCFQDFGFPPVHDEAQGRSCQRTAVELPGRTCAFSKGKSKKLGSFSPTILSQCFLSHISPKDARDSRMAGVSLIPTVRNLNSPKKTYLESKTIPWKETQVSH